MAEKTNDAAGKPKASETPETQLGTVRYRVMKKCFWNARLLYQGDTVEVKSGTEVPAYFTKL